MDRKQIIVDWKIASYLISRGFVSDKCLLFLHWWKQNSDSFLKILELLEANNISFISIDLPWFWKSSDLKEDWGIKEYSEFIVSFIKKLELTNPILVAHSFWCRIAIYIWANYNIVSKLILIWAWSIKPKIDKIKYCIVKIWKIIFSIPWLNIIWNFIKKKLRSEDYNESWSLKWTFLKVINEDISNLPSRVDVPVLLIWWKQDTVTPLNQWIELNKLIPDSKIEIFEKGTHFVFQEFPQEVSNLILNFL